MRKNCARPPTRVDLLSYILSVQVIGSPDGVEPITSPLCRQQSSGHACTLPTVIHVAPQGPHVSPAHLSPARHRTRSWCGAYACTAAACWLAEVPRRIPCISWFESSRMGASSSCRTALLSTTLVRKACWGAGRSERPVREPSHHLSCTEP